MAAKKPTKPKAKKPRARKPAAKPDEVRGPLPAALPPKPADKAGRPTQYDPALAQEMLELLADGLTLNAVCADERFPAPRTVRRWALDDQHPFSPLYARAREIGYHSMADDLFDQADDGRNDWIERNDPDNPGWTFNGENVQRSRLRVETRKWFLSKALPKIYGDRMDHNVSVDFVSSFESYIREINKGREAIALTESSGSLSGATEFSSNYAHAREATPDRSANGQHTNGSVRRRWE